MQNVRLDRPQTGLKLDRGNINNLTYANNATLMAKSEEELKSFLIRVKEDWEKTGLKLNIKKKKTQKLRSWHLVP